MSASPNRKASLEIPKVTVRNHHGSLTSLTSSNRSYSPGSSPLPGRKILGLKKMMPWRKKSRELLDTEDKEVVEMRDDASIEHSRKKKETMEDRTKKFETRKKRSRSVDQLLSDPTIRNTFDKSTRHSGAYSENDPSITSPARSSPTDEESCDSANESYDIIDGVDPTEHLNQQRVKLRRKVEKTKERMKTLQSSMDENLKEYLESVQGNPDPETSKKVFEKKNCKSNTHLGLMQKKLDKYKKALKEVETHEQRARSHTAKEVLRGVKTSVKELSGGVRDNVKAGFSGVSKFFNSNENITADAQPLSSKSDSEYYDYHGEELYNPGGYERACAPSPRPFSYDDDFSQLSPSQISPAATAATSPKASSSPKYFDAIADNPFQTKLKELQEAQIKLQETVEKALSNMNAIATSLQDERYKTQHLELQFNEIRSHWNDFSELHQNEIMVLRQEMERADERIETVDYRIVERVAEIDESFDTFDARISKLENQHHQQGITVDDYLDQNTQAKAVLTRFLSVLLAILTLLFSVFTLIVHGIAPLTKTRLRLVITSLLVVFLALWWHSPEHPVFVRFQQNLVQPLARLVHVITSKLPRLYRNSPHGGTAAGAVIKTKDS